MGRVVSYNEDVPRCTFCGKTEHQVRKLVAGPSAAICDECIELCVDIVSEERQHSADVNALTLPKPAEISAYLDRYMFSLFNFSFKVRDSLSCVFSSTISWSFCSSSSCISSVKRRSSSNCSAFFDSLDSFIYITSFLYLLFQFSNSVFCFSNKLFSLFRVCANFCHC